MGRIETNIGNSTLASDWPDYELIDFGDGRKLERWGETLVDRPAPAAAGEVRTRLAEWKSVDWRYTGERVGDGRWRRTRSAATWPESVACRVTDEQRFVVEIERLPTGQVGLFPEQLDNWRWLTKRITRSVRTMRLLNLFGYTGGSTLAAAFGGAEVTHVDASKPAVNRARRNAELSGLAERPIRWIVEDVFKYVEREVKRGSQYDAIVLDPPSYGHGPKGEAWQFARDLPKLLRLCRALTIGTPQLVLLTCHTPGVGPADLSAYLSDGLFGHCGQPPSSYPLRLRATDGRYLDSGVAARWPAS